MGERAAKEEVRRRIHKESEDPSGDDAFTTLFDLWTWLHSRTDMNDRDEDPQEADRSDVLKAALLISITCTSLMFIYVLLTTTSAFEARDCQGHKCGARSHWECCLALCWRSGCGRPAKQHGRMVLP